MGKSLVRPGIKIFKDSDGKGSHFWRVRLGKKFTGGAVIRKNFRTQNEANKFVEEQEAPKRIHGNSYFQFTPQQLSDARAALAVIGDQGTLFQAAQYWKKHARPSGGVRTFNEIYHDFITSRKASNLKPSTIRQYCSSLGIICDTFGKVALNQIQAEDIEDWLDEPEWKAKTRRNYLTDFTTVLNWAMNRKYCIENVAANIPRPKVDEHKPGILTPAQAEKLLQAATLHQPDMIPGIAIGLFAGLRRSEICALRWENIKFHYSIKNKVNGEVKDVDELPQGKGFTVVSYGSIEVGSSIAKNRQRRLFPIQENLRAWLTPFREKGISVSYSIDRYGDHLRQLVKNPSNAPDDKDHVPIIDPWPHNALRHSYASYRLADIHDENTVAQEMGNSPQIIHAHYKGLVSESATSQYWNIFPSEPFVGERVSNTVQISA